MEWLGQILASDVLRGGALLVAVVTGIAAITMQFLRNQPVLVKLEDEARKALDDSMLAELRRLAERVSDAEHRHSECESLLQTLRADFRTIEETMAGLRRQLVQYQETTVRTLRNQRAAPKGSKG